MIWAVAIIKKCKSFKDENNIKPANNLKVISLEFNF